MLFPHLTVADNIAYGLRGRIPRAEIAGRVAALGANAGVSALLDRRPRDLSGGEQQRVALARVFAIEPVVVLLDEPLGALDAPSREATLDEMQQMLAASGATVMHVTHDLDEAIDLGDTIVVLHEGVVRQVGCPEDVLAHPTSASVARLMGARNVFTGEAVRGGVTLVDGVEFRSAARMTGRVGAVVRAEDIIIARGREGIGAHNNVQGVIVGMERRAADVLVTIDAGVTLTAQITRSSYRTLEPAVGERVWASFDASVVHLCAPE